MRLYPQPTLVRSKGTASQIRFIESPMLVTGAWWLVTGGRCSVNNAGIVHQAPTTSHQPPVSPLAAEAELHHVPPRLHRARGDVPGLLRFLVQAAIHGTA